MNLFLNKTLEQNGQKWIQITKFFQRKKSSLTFGEIAIYRKWHLRLINVIYTTECIALTPAGSALPVVATPYLTHSRHFGALRERQVKDSYFYIYVCFLKVINPRKIHSKYVFCILILWLKLAFSMWACNRFWRILDYRPNSIHIFW